VRLYCLVPWKDNLSLSLCPSVERISVAGKLIDKRDVSWLRRSISIPTMSAFRIYAHPLRVSPQSLGAPRLIGTATWRHKVTRIAARVSAEEEGAASWKPFGARRRRTDFTASPRARSQMGRRDIKTGCAYTSRRNAVYIRSPYSRYIHVSSSPAGRSAFLTLRHGAWATLGLALRVRTYAPLPKTWFRDTRTRTEACFGFAQGDAAIRYYYIYWVTTKYPVIKATW